MLCLNSSTQRTVGVLFVTTLNSKNRCHTHHNPALGTKWYKYLATLRMGLPLCSECQLGRTGVPDDALPPRSLHPRCWLWGAIHLTFRAQDNAWPMSQLVPRFSGDLAIHTTQKCWLNLDIRNRLRIEQKLICEVWNCAWMCENVRMSTYIKIWA